MLKFTDAQWSAVREMAEPIPVPLRSDYLNAVASALSGVRDLGDGDVHKAARKVQQQILHRPGSNGGEVLDGRTGEPLTPRERALAIAARNPKFKIASGDNLGCVIGGARPNVSR